MFVEGTVVIPGQVSYSDQVATIQLASTFAGETIVPSQYYNSTSPVIITGATTGLKARVIGVQEATATTQPILIIQYLNTGSDFQTAFFSDGENLSADVAITHTTSYTAESVSTTTFSSKASQRGSAVKLEEGVYFVRGQFVKCAEETLILSTNTFTLRIRLSSIILFLRLSKYKCIFEQHLYLYLELKHLVYLNQNKSPYFLLELHFED